jgi:hypothetical protein
MKVVQSGRLQPWMAEQSKSSVKWKITPKIAVKTEVIFCFRMVSFTEFFVHFEDSWLSSYIGVGIRVEAKIAAACSFCLNLAEFTKLIVEAVSPRMGICSMWRDGRIECGCLKL